jgi:hypothetical protein
MIFRFRQKITDPFIRQAADDRVEDPCFFQFGFDVQSQFGDHFSWGADN